MNDEKFPFLDTTDPDMLFTSKMQEHAQVGCLRAGFNRKGELESDWLGKNDDLKTLDFQNELTSLLDGFKKNGPLESLSALREFCRKHPEAYMDTGKQKVYAFRIDTPQHRYLLRFFPQKPKNHLYVFSYRTELIRDDFPHPNFSSYIKAGRKKVNLTVLNAGENNLIFENSGQQQAFVGHLYGFWSKNNQLETFWMEQNSELKTQEFQTEVESLIYDLYCDGPLLDSHTLQTFCEANPEAYYNPEEPYECYAFRIEMPKHRYFMRRTLSQDESGFHLICYQTDLLREHGSMQISGTAVAADKPVIGENAGYQITDRFETGKYGFVLGRRDVEGSTRFATWEYERTAPNDYLCGHYFNTAEEAFSDYEFRITDDLDYLHQLTGEWPSLPPWCMSVDQKSGNLISLRRGVMGSFDSAQNHAGDPKLNREIADRINEKIGVSKVREMAMLQGSILGWDNRLADPKTYYKSSRVLPPNAAKKRRTSHDR